MRDPKRLIGGDDPTADALLRSARSDAPSAKSKQRAAVALGLAAASAASSAAGTSAAAAGGASLGALSLKVVAVSTLIGAVTVTVAVKSLWRAHPALQTPSPIASIASPLRAEHPSLSASPDVDPPSAPTGEDISLPVAPVNSLSRITSTKKSARAPEVVRSDAAPATTPPSSAQTATLADEIAKLDRARANLDRGAAEAALDDVDAYARAFPNGVLAPEAAVIRMEAVARRGSCDELRALSRAFLNAYPSAPQVARVRSLVTSCTPK